MLFIISKFRIAIEGTINKDNAINAKVMLKPTFIFFHTRHWGDVTCCHVEQAI